MCSIHPDYYMRKSWDMGNSQNCMVLRAFNQLQWKSALNVSGGQEICTWWGKPSECEWGTGHIHGGKALWMWVGGRTYVHGGKALWMWVGGRTYVHGGKALWMWVGDRKYVHGMDGPTHRPTQINQWILTVLSLLVQEHDSVTLLSQKMFTIGCLRSEDDFLSLHLFIFSPTDLLCSRSKYNASTINHLLVCVFLHFNLKLIFSSVT